MCYADRSLEQATSTCAMCKVFPPRNYSCPHKDSMGVCKNRVNHPRHDVVHFRNAELSSFNGCGFCKWAKRHPKIQAADAAWKNPGWPGCCRPPKSNEYEYISGADWYAISKIHGVSVPAAPTPGASPAFIHTPPNKSPSNSPPSRSKTIASPRILERRDSGSRDSGTPYSASAVRDIPLSPSTSRASSDIRRRSNSDTSRKPDTLAPVRAPVVTREPPATAPRSPTRLPNTNPPRRDCDIGRSGVSIEEKDRDKDRRTATKTYNSESAFATIRGPLSHLDPPPPRPNNPAIPRSSASSGSSSSSSSSSRSSMTQSGTVTSEGFTDYLSDESEVEMQREAERRAGEAELAAKLERTKLELGREEQEFRAARTQLASVGLQPPPAWSSGKLPVATGRMPAASVGTTTFTTTARPARSPGTLFGSHPVPPAPSYVQVYSVARQ